MSVSFLNLFFLPTVVRGLCQFYSLVDKEFSNGSIAQVAFLSYFLYHRKKYFFQWKGYILKSVSLIAVSQFFPRRILLLIQHNKSSERFQSQNQRQQAQTKLQDVPSEHCKTFTVRVTEHWHRLFCGVSMLINLQKPLGHNLGNLLYLALPGQGNWTMWPAEVPLSFNHSVIKLSIKNNKSHIFVKQCVAQMATVSCLQFCNSLRLYQKGLKDITLFLSGFC